MRDDFIGSRFFLSKHILAFSLILSKEILSAFSRNTILDTSENSEYSEIKKMNNIAD